jgi:hypothetical protein
MKFVRYFLYILAAALGSTLLGGAFACLIALLSPEFVKGLFGPVADTGLVRYAAAVGMVWGLFLGSGVMAFCLFLTTIHEVAGVFQKESKTDERGPA